MGRKRKDIALEEEFESTYVTAEPDEYGEYQTSRIRLTEHGVLNVNRQAHQALEGTSLGGFSEQADEKNTSFIPDLEQPHEQVPEPLVSNSRMSCCHI